MGDVVRPFKAVSFVDFVRDNPGADTAHVATRFGIPVPEALKGMTGLRLGGGVVGVKGTYSTGGGAGGVTWRWWVVSRPSFPTRTRVRVPVATPGEARAYVEAGIDEIAVATGRFPLRSTSVVADDVFVRINEEVGGVARVTALVNETDPDAVLAAVRRLGTHSVQVTGRLTPGDARRLAAGKGRTSLAVSVRAFGPDAMSWIRAYEASFDTLVVETPGPYTGVGAGTGTSRYPHLGVAASFVRACASSCTLSGSFGPEDVGAVVRTVRPDCLDLVPRPGCTLASSTVRDVLEAVRAADEDLADLVSSTPVHRT